MSGPMNAARAGSPNATLPITVAISAITGSFAPHGIQVVVIIVMRRSFSFSIVRLAMIPGIPQPEEIKSGMNDFPLKPNFLKSLSITNAIRTI